MSTNQQWQLGRLPTANHCGVILLRPLPYALAHLVTKQPSSSIVFRFGLVVKSAHHVQATRLLFPPLCSLHCSRHARRPVTNMIAEPQPPSAIFHRSLTKTYPTATTGQGVYITQSDGSKILDGSCGAAVSCLGHGHQAVIEAITEQARQLSFAHTSFFTSDPAEELVSLLIKSSDGRFSTCMFLSSGKRYSIAGN